MTVRAEDRLEVLELYARYAYTFDAGDASAWARCFTPEGVLRTSRPLEVRGHAALEAFARDWWTTADATPRHLSWHHVLEADGDEVTGLCTAALLQTRQDGVAIAFTALYRDRFARTPEGWRIAERVVELDRPPAAAGLVSQ